MTRKRTLRKSFIPDPAAHQGAGDMDGMRGRLSQEQTGNYGMIDSRGRSDIREIRNLERDSVVHLHSGSPSLPNPNHSASFDKRAPLTRIDKNEAFGYQVQEDRLIDLPPGDAGAGKSMYRRSHFFARLDDPNNSTVAGNPMDKAIGMATYRSSDCRPRFWHVSFFGIAVQRSANFVPVEPLSNSEILSRQLKPTVTGAVSSRGFVPAITQLQGRIMVFDESGQRFYDVDIMGNRSLDVYAWGVTAFVLGPANLSAPDNQSMYEVNHGSGGGLPQTALGGLVEDAIIGVRIVPITINSTQNSENRTITVVTDDTGDTRVPIPPGARRVQVISHEAPSDAALFLITFDSGDDGTFVGASTQGIININAAESKSNVLLIPNSVQIIFRALPGAPSPAGWSLVFTVESQ